MSPPSSRLSVREAPLWGAFETARCLFRDSLSGGRGSLASALAAADSFAAPGVGPDPLPISEPSTCSEVSITSTTGSAARETPTTYDKRGRCRWDVGGAQRLSSPSLSYRRGDLRETSVSVGGGGLGKRMAVWDRGLDGMFHLFVRGGDAPRGCQCMWLLSNDLEKTTASWAG